MKKIIKISGIIALSFGVLILAGMTFFNMRFPKVDKAKDIHIESTLERVDRGRYLANYVAGCIDCHSERDWTKYGGPLIPGTEGKGGMKFDKELADVPGTIYAKNITPAGIGDWTDGELLRMITTGVNKKGEAIFPIMPYLHYRNMSQEDLYSIIAYIRTLKPIENNIPERHFDFPMNLIVKTIPVNAPEKFGEKPLVSDTLAYGSYLVNAAACLDCHSKLIKGQIEPGMEFAGGFAFHFPSGQSCTSANITPDVETGIGLLTKEAFLDKFRFYRQESARTLPVEKDGNLTVMPWIQFSSLTDNDLSAIYDYLKSLKPVKNKIEKFTRKS